MQKRGQMLAEISTVLLLTRMRRRGHTLLDVVENYEADRR
jgi:hypothetical protein